MNRSQPFTIKTLEDLCDEKAEESLTLEFKPCNELRIGSEFHDRKKGQKRERTRDDVINELSKDVSSFLNSAGGTIIYGITEKKSRADSIDREHAFTPADNISPEKITEWLRAHIQPIPPADLLPYTVQDDPTKGSGWYIVIEIPQGQRAYMARDHVHYRRTGNVRKPMERFEIDDVMNRMRGAMLVADISISSVRKLDDVWNGFSLHPKVMSENFLTSEYGMLKLSIVSPATVGRLQDRTRLGISRELASPELLPNSPSVETIRLRWGADQGSVILPGDWYDFGDNSISIEVPVVPDFLLRNQFATFLIRTELFTNRSPNRISLFALRKRPPWSDEEFEVIKLDVSNYENLIDEYRNTYDAAETFLEERRKSAPR